MINQCLNETQQFFAAKCQRNGKTMTYLERSMTEQNITFLKSCANTDFLYIL